MKKKSTKPKPVRNKNTAFIVGKIYFIQTVTLYYTGKLVVINDQELVLEDASWIADTGRFADAIKSLQFKEVEPFPDGPVIVGRGALISARQISSSPRVQT